MNVPETIIPSSSDDLETADRALIQRPRASIRLRLALLFMATFLLICLLTGSALFFLSRLGVKQLFIEKADNYAAEIQQARRFEKNFLLYGTGLDDALVFSGNARQVLDAARDEFCAVIGVPAYTRMNESLHHYNELLIRLGEISGRTDPLSVDRRDAFQADLRHSGATLMAEAADAVEKERFGFHHWLHSARFFAAMALGLILIIGCYIVFFIYRKVFLPFKRFERYMRRIAAGDFSPVTPAKKFQDEFTDLAVAINRMLKEIQDRGNQLVESRKMAAIGTLTAGIAHEINNPLNNISLTVESLLDDFSDMPDADKLEMLREIFSQVERAGATVANLLDFTHRDQSAFSPLFIQDVLSGTAALLKNELQLNNVRLSLQMPETLPPINGHQQNLQQVFLNLFINAEEAMPEGGDLTVRCELQDAYVRVDVSDTGSGITEADLPHIFDPFFTTKAVGKGTGLGLSVSFGIVAKHHGIIRARSEAGKGTTFTVLLPRENQLAIG